MDSRFNAETEMRASAFFDGSESNQKYSRFWMLPVPTTDQFKSHLTAARIETDDVTVNLVPIYTIELG